MKKLGYFVLILAIACLIGMVSAEVITIADNDGNGNAYSYTVASTDTELAVSGVMVTGADPTSTVVSGGDDTGLLTSAGNAATVTGADTFVAGSSAMEMGGSSASTSVVATGNNNVAVTEAQGATTSSVIGGSAAGQATIVSAPSVDATSVAVAQDDAVAGATVSAANMNGAIVQGAVGIGLAAAGQAVQTGGVNQQLYAETWAEAGTNYAETTTVADLNTGMILVYQGAVADPTLLGGFAAAGQYARYGGNGFVGSFTDAEGSNSEAEADIEADTHGGSYARMAGEYVQGAATNSEGSIAGQTGTIGNIPIKDIPTSVHVEAETEAEGSGTETEAEAEMHGTAIEFGQASGATADGEVGSIQKIPVFSGRGFVETEVENAAGSEASTFAGTRDNNGMLIINYQYAVGDNDGVLARQKGSVSAPSGTGMMETYVENGNFPGNYASVAVGVEDGRILPTGQSAQTIGSDAYASQIASVSGNFESAWTKTEAGDAFGNHAAVGTRAIDGNLLATNSYAHAGGAYMEADEFEMSDAASTTQWANARSFHDRDRFSHTYSGVVGSSELIAHSNVFGHTWIEVVV